MGKKHPPAYRLKMFIMRLWQQWERITLKRHYPHLDGTNNACERVIGWWMKERYHSMRGYKRPDAIRNGVTLTAALAACPGFDMQLLYG